MGALTHALLGSGTLAPVLVVGCDLHVRAGVMKRCVHGHHVWRSALLVSTCSNRRVCMHFIDVLRCMLRSTWSQVHRHTYLSSLVAANATRHQCIPVAVAEGLHSVDRAEQ